MFDRFTDRARKVMGISRQEAIRFNHDYIGPEHMLLGIVLEGSGVAVDVIKALDRDPKVLARECAKLMQSGPTKVTLAQLPFAAEGKRALELSLEEASNLGHAYIGSEHLLLGIMRVEQGIAAAAIKHAGLNVQDVRDEVLNLLGSSIDDSTSRLDPPTPYESPLRTDLESLRLALMALTERVRALEERQR